MKRGRRAFPDIIEKLMEDCREADWKRASGSLYFLDFLPYNGMDYVWESLIWSMMISKR